MTDATERRPPLTSALSPEDFRDFYWLKSELLDFCRVEGLRSSGSKIEIADRVEHYLRTGQAKEPERQTRPSSSFDWNRSELTTETVITDSYRNTRTVRAFFVEQLGPSFRFSVPFMAWMKSNAGKTLGDAVEAWKQLKGEAASARGPKNIAPQFEFNRYVRDFLADNPGRPRSEALACWKAKRSRRGSNAYERSDLRWLAT